MDHDQKLTVLVDSLGESADIKFAREILEALDWDLEAAMNTITGGSDGIASSNTPMQAEPAQTVHHGVDAEGYRAPMRTGYTDTLLGSVPQELVWEHAAAFDRGGSHGGAFGTEFIDGHSQDDVHRAMRTSATEYSRVTDQHEQGALAEAIEQSYALHAAQEQRRLSIDIEARRKEQQKMASAIEASYQEQCGADAEYRKQLELAKRASTEVDNMHAFPRSNASFASSAASAKVVWHSGSTNMGSNFPREAAFVPGPVPHLGAPSTSAFARGIVTKSGSAGSSIGAQGERHIVTTSTLCTPGAVSVRNTPFRNGTTPPQDGTGAHGSASLHPSQIQVQPKAPIQRLPASPPLPGTVKTSAEQRSLKGPPPSVPRAGLEGPDLGANHKQEMLRPLTNQGFMDPAVSSAPGQTAVVQEGFETDQRRRAAEEAERARIIVAQQQQKADAEQQRQIAAEKDRQRLTQLEAYRQKREAEQAQNQQHLQLEQQKEEEHQRLQLEQQKKEEQPRRETEEVERRKRAALEAERQRVAEEERCQETIAEKDEATKAEELRCMQEKVQAKQQLLEPIISAEPRVENEAEYVVRALIALRRQYLEADAVGLATCLQTLRTYIGNLARSPHEPKFQRIRSDNKAFRTRIAAFKGATAVLQACGFNEEHGAWVADPGFLKTKGPRLWDALAKVDVMLDQVQRLSKPRQPKPRRQNYVFASCLRFGMLCNRSI